MKARQSRGIIVVLLLALLPSLAFTQHLGEREQWQPETESDSRLQQPVNIEIVGRAAVPALQLLSEETGVSLVVLPENVDTVGERKLTIIAQGCSLKAIMVQLPKALRECHWDIDPSGDEPVYLLHRNAGTETTMAQLSEEESRRHQEERRPAREARLAEARTALAMSPEQLAELSKTDPFLAATVRDPESRQRLRLLLGLPTKDMQDFITTGRAYLEYASAPEDYQEAAQRVRESFLEDAGASEHPALHAWAKVISDVLPQAAICFEEGGSLGVSLVLQCYDTEGAAGRKGDFLRAGGGGALPPRLPAEHVARHLYGPLLLKAGFDEKTLDVIIADQAEQRAEQERERRDRKRALEWREPRSPALHKVVTLPFKDNVDKVEIQRFIAEETGLSLVSDYFTTSGSGQIPEEAKTPMPVWRLLYLLGESWFWRYEWNEAGDCLVFHDRRWYICAPQEFPESMALAYREKLEKQGRFTLDDVAAAAVELARRRPVPPRERGEWRWSFVNVPGDLAKAGLAWSVLRSEALLLYASLSREQKAKARSAVGLSYTEMSVAQRELMRPYAFFTGGWNRDRHPIPEGQITRGVYRIRQSTRQVGSETRDVFELIVEFPSLHEITALTLRVPKPPAQSRAAGGRSRE